MEVIFLEKARKDIRDAFDWYERKQFGLGSQFLKDVISHSKKIGKDSIEYRKYISDIQYIQLLRFPFSIFFIKEGTSKAFIVAVLHNRQDVVKVLTKRE